MPESMSIQATRWITDPQDSCPLFTRFPPEIRQEIFSYALSEHDSHLDIHGRPRVRFPVNEPKWLVCDLPEDTSKPMPEHSSLENVDLCYYSPRKKSIGELDGKCSVWLRPGTSAARFQHTSILRTCRRVFLEARDLIMKNATLRIFTHGYFSRRTRTMSVGVHSKSCMTRYTANRLTSLEIYIPQWSLEVGFKYKFRGNDNLRCVQDLRITICKHEWRESDTFGPGLTPYGDGLEWMGDRHFMEEHMQLEEKHDQGRAPIPPIPYTRFLKFKEGSWGELLGMIPNLKRLTMDFDYSEDRFQKLKELAEWAQRVWTFRLGGEMKGYYLSAKDNPIKRISWRGLATHMGAKIICPNEDCPTKSSDPDQEGSDNTEKPECCAETEKRMGYGFGPRMYTFTVTWTARKLEPEDGDDPTIPGPDELEAQWPEERCDSLAP
ncbi:hypothetical protein N0V84_009870 [Fusarium piperis]|uniref:DUF7730 domain-containing protein n=1 Tax=Fusarium piperis TaxID=1435070 RepID=A0A9W9BHF7_9HYPO|nr:hypothetical protein N0V84_009870 [Fusarium piperis]